MGWAIGSRRGAGAARRTTAGPPFVYWPLAGPFLLAAVIVAVVLAGLLLVGVVTYALGRLGIGPQAAALVLAGSLLGGAVNIPIARFRDRAVRMEDLVLLADAPERADQIPGFDRKPVGPLGQAISIPAMPTSVSSRPRKSPVGGLRRPRVGNGSGWARHPGAPAAARIRIRVAR